MVRDIFCTRATANDLCFCVRPDGFERRDTLLWILNYSRQVVLPFEITCLSQEYSRGWRFQKPSHLQQK